MTKSPRRAATKPEAPPRPARAFGRRLADMTNGRALTKAEQTLLEACRRGEFAEIGATRPDAATADNTIHADLLRFLILGGDEDNPVHEQGVRVKGAWIAGALDLEHCRTDVAILCVLCRFSGDLVLVDAQLAGLSLVGSAVPGIAGDGLNTSSAVILRAFVPTDGSQSVPFEARGEVRLRGAAIGGDVDCSGGRFLAKKGYALICDGMVTKGGVFLNNGFEAKGTVRLLGAAIGGDLVCKGGGFLAKEGDALSCDRMVTKGGVFLHDGFEATGTVRLPGATIGGNLDCSGGRFLANKGEALNCDGMAVTGAFYLRGGAKIAGWLDLAGARVGVLVDDAACWPERGWLVLDGFRYDHLAGKAPTTAAVRQDWLMRQGLNHCGSDFRPQPWRQAIRVLREMGHDAEARTLAVAFESQRACVIGGARRLLHDLYGLLAGYGHRPLLLVRWALAVWLACTLFYQNAADSGLMAPTHPLVFESPAYDQCRPRAGSQTSWTNSATCNGPNEYTAFQPFLYSLDLILPLVDLQQEKDWAPMVTRPATADARGPAETSSLGQFIRLLMWFEILFGWAASLLFVAILSGLVKKSGDE